MIIAALISSEFSNAAYGTVLIFDGVSGSPPWGAGGLDDRGKGYGDRVTTTPEGDFQYDLSGGPTPNIDVVYRSGSTIFSTWHSNYGDLTNVIWPAYSTSGVFNLVLDADPGFLVRLHSFDIAGWPNTDYTVNSIKVLDENLAELFTESQVLVHGDSNGPRRTHIEFANPLVGQMLTIRVDAANLAQNFVNIGLDNIFFSQVPEPTSALLILAGTMFLLATFR